MLEAVLIFEDHEKAHVSLQARPLKGEMIHYNGDRYSVKRVVHHAATASSNQPPLIEIHLGTGRGGSHAKLLENSPRGFYTG